MNTLDELICVVLKCDATMRSRKAQIKQMTIANIITVSIIIYPHKLTAMLIYITWRRNTPPKLSLIVTWQTKQTRNPLAKKAAQKNYSRITAE